MYLYVFYLVKKREQGGRLLIADVKITDPEKFKDYGSLVPETVEKHEGKYLIRGGDYEVMEEN